MGHKFQVNSSTMPVMLNAEWANEYFYCIFGDSHSWGAEIHCGRIWS